MRTKNSWGSARATPLSEAQNRLLEEYFDEAKRFISKKLAGDSRRSDSLESDMFIAFWDAVRKFNPADDGDFWTYARRFLKVASTRRNASKLRACVSLSHHEFLEGSLADTKGWTGRYVGWELELEEEVDQLYRFIKKLSLSQQTVIQLRYIEEMSVRNTAYVMAVSFQNVSQLEEKAMRHLRAMYGIGDATQRHRHTMREPRQSHSSHQKREDTYEENNENVYLDSI
jgi:RNA polymerase sigma factor (sigma-70 family)